MIVTEVSEFHTREEVELQAQGKEKESKHQ